MVTIPQDTIQKVLQYLATKPFQEVAQLIQEIHENSKLIEEKD
jgi:hypothetical protein